VRDSARCMEEKGRQRRRRKLAEAAREVDVLRLEALRADEIADILPSRSRLRHSAVDDDVAQVDGLHVVARQVDVEVEHRHRQIGPDHEVGQNRGGRRVVHREESGEPVRVIEIHLEVRQGNVAAGTASMVQMTADAGVTGASKPRTTQGMPRVASRTSPSFGSSLRPGAAEEGLRLSDSICHNSNKPSVSIGKGPGTPGPSVLPRVEAPGALRHGVIRRAGAVEPGGAEADAETPAGVHHDRHPGLPPPAGSNGGFGLPEIVVFRSRKSQPKVNGTREVRAVDQRSAETQPGTAGCRLWRLREKGKVVGVLTCSVSSKMSMPSWPSGNQLGRPVVAGQVKGFWLVFESRQTMKLVPPVKSPPVDVTAGKGGGEGLAMVARVPTQDWCVAAVEGYTGRRWLWPGRSADASMWTRGIAVGEVLAGVDVEVVAPRARS